MSLEPGAFKMHQRCQAYYTLWNDPLDEPIMIQCRAMQEHTGAHEALSKTGLSVSWTTLEGLKSYQEYLDAHREAVQNVRIKHEKRTTPFTAWRVWRLCVPRYDPDDVGESRLQSITMHHRWHGPTMTTELDEDDHPKNVMSWKVGETPERDEGVFCYKTPRYLQDYHGVDGVAGRIECLGHVVEHEYGYRAQRVIIRELWLIDDGGYYAPPMSTLEAIVPHFEKLYACPVHILNVDQITHWANYYTEEFKNV